MNCNWARARFGFVKQLLICKGTITKAELITEYGGEDNIPDHFSPDKLSQIHPDALSWWDESHKDCVVSDFGGKAKTKTQFPRNTKPMKG